MIKVSQTGRVVASLVVAATGAVASAAPTVSVVSSFQVDSLGTTALGVNATGQLAGFHSYTATSSTSGKPKPGPVGSIAFVTGAGGATPAEVDPITGVGVAVSGPCKGLLLSDALVAINASGAAVGTSAVAMTSGTKTSYAVHAVLYTGTTLTDLGTLGGGSSAARAINASGLVVGLSEVGRGKVHAFSSNGTTMTDLGTLGGDSSEALAVNDAGVIVGDSAVAKHGVHPFSYANGTMTDLGLPANFTGATATAIASNGLIVGFGGMAVSSSSGKSGGKGGNKPAPPVTASFVYSGTTFTALPGLFSDKKGNATPLRAEGVNAAGVVVGGTLDASGKPKAFVYAGGTTTDLTTLLPSSYSGWTVVDATAISDTGYVSAVGLDATGKQYALLLKLS